MFTTKNLFTHLGKHILITAGALVLTTAIVIIISGQITKISKKSVEDRHLAAALGERASLISNLKRETEIIGTNDEIIKQAFIPSNNILSFVAVIENLALRNGMTQSFHFSTPTPSAEGGPFPLSTITYQNTISASGVSSLINYLNEFNQLPYFTKIDSLSISAGSGDWRTSSTASYSATVVAQSPQ